MGFEMKKNLLKEIKRNFIKFFAQEQGTVAILTGLLFFIVIGFAALAIDSSFWYSDRRKLQFAADAGAVGGAIALRQTGKSTITTYATRDIQLNNPACTAGGSSCNIVAINNPPTTGLNVGNSQAVEVILSKPTTMFLAGFFLANTPTLQTRAVATAGTAAPNCFVTLGSAGLSLVGGSKINALGCSVYSDSTISGAGTSSITANTVNATGSISATLVPPTVSNPNAPALPDPYSNLQVPSYSGCTQTNYSGSPASIGPGVYCGGFSITGGTVNMSPGTYIINGGSVSFNGHPTINGTGVTFILTSSTGKNYPSINDAGGTTFNLSSPTTGPFAGILFFEDRNAPSPSIKLAGDTFSGIGGTMYFPSGNVTFTGNSVGTGNSCIQVVANSITLKGGATLTNPATCGGGTIKPVQLVE